MLLANVRGKPSCYDNQRSLASVTSSLASRAMKIFLVGAGAMLDLSSSKFDASGSYFLKRSPDELRARPRRHSRNICRVPPV